MKVTTAAEVWAIGAIVRTKLNHCIPSFSPQRASLLTCVKVGSLHMGGPNILFRPLREPRGLDGEGSINWVRAMYTLLPFPASFAQRAPHVWQARFEDFRASPQIYKGEIPTEFDVVRQLFNIPEDDWDLVYNMLQIDPEERMSALDLLSTTYFIPRWKWLLRHYTVQPLLVGLQWVLDRTWNAYILKAQAEAKAEASRGRD